MMAALSSKKSRRIAGKKETIVSLKDHKIIWSKMGLPKQGDIPSRPLLSWIYYSRNQVSFQRRLCNCMAALKETSTHCLFFQ